MRCTYCAFNLFTRAEALIPAYIRALCQEIAGVGAAARSTALGEMPLPAHTIYLGGGTPSLLTPAQVGHILDTCRRAFAITPDAEVTMEANPGDIDLAYLQAVREAGISRLSIGMQSAHTDELRLMARDHRPDAVPNAFRAAREAHIPQVGLDLIFGLPRQTMGAWQESVQAALALKPDHLSMYALEIEDGTAMTRRIQRGGLPAPDDDLAARMYEYAGDIATAAGLFQYEISNWARPGCEARHNLQYWRHRPYLGFGAGAHGFAAGMRYEVQRDLRAYLATMQTETLAQPSFPLSPAVVESTLIPPAEQMLEYMFTGLRLTREGVSAAAFAARFGSTLESVYGPKLRALADLGLVQWNGDQLALTPAARLVSNQVTRALME